MDADRRQARDGGDDRGDVDAGEPAREDFIDHIDIGALAPLSQFLTRAKCAALYRETVYAAVGARIEVLNFQGVVKKILPFSESEGAPAFVDVWGDFLAAASTTGVVKLWNIKRADPVQVVPGRSFDEYALAAVRLRCACV